MLSAIQFKKNKAQVWIETVIYTLIGLVIIGILISVITPSINQKKDQILIQGSLDMLKTKFENSIEDLRYYGVGNSRTIEMNLKKGILEIDSLNDSIIFKIDSKYKFSEVNQTINDGKIIKLTQQKASGYEVKFILNYSSIVNISYNNQEKVQTFNSAPTPYKIVMTNKGSSGIVQIDFSSIN